MEEDTRPEAERAEPAPQDDVSEVNVKAVVWTIGLATAFAVGAHGLIGLNYWLGVNQNPGDDLNAPWQAIVGAGLTGVALVSFGGFYIATSRARVAIASTFILTFLVMLPFALTIPELGTNAETEFAQELVRQFSTVVGTVVAFYFGSEAVISGLKIWTIAQKAGATAEAVKRADRDLATHSVRQPD